HLHEDTENPLGLAGIASAHGAVLAHQTVHHLGERLRARLKDGAPVEFLSMFSAAGGGVGTGRALGFRDWRILRLGSVPAEVTADPAFAERALRLGVLPG